MNKKRLFSSLTYLIFFLNLFNSDAYAQAQEVWHYLSNEGDATLIVRAPNYYSVPDRAQHVAIIPFKTRVEVYETRQDPSLSILKWSRVKVLEGQHRGQEGWVSSRNVIESREPRSSELHNAQQNERTQRAVNNLGEVDIQNVGHQKTLARVVSETQLRSRPAVANSELAAPKLPIETQLERLSDKPVLEKFGVDLLWWNVLVLDGPNKGQKGWVLDSHIAIEKPRLPYDSVKALAYAVKYCQGGNACSTGEYGSFANPGTLLANLTSTDCAHFMAHVLYAGGPKAGGVAIASESGLTIRYVELKAWFQRASSKYANVSLITSWTEAKQGDYCFLGEYRHVVLLADVPRKDGAKVYGHSVPRCGDAAKFKIPISTIYRIEDYPTK